MVFLLKGKNISKLTPVKRVVHKKGKTFMQTFYIAQKETKINFPLNIKPILEMLKQYKFSKQVLNDFKAWIAANKNNSLEIVSMKYFVGGLMSKDDESSILRFKYIIQDPKHSFFSLVSRALLSSEVSRTFDTFYDTIYASTGIDPARLVVDENVKDLDDVKSELIRLELRLKELYEKTDTLAEPDLRTEGVLYAFKKLKENNIPIDAKAQEKFFTYLKEYLDKYSVSEKNIPVMNQKVSYYDLVHLLEWAETSWANVRNQVTGLDTGFSSFDDLNSVSRSLLSMVKELDYPVLYRGTKNGDTWAYADVGSVLSLGLASFTTEPKIAHEFSLQSDSRILPILVYLGREKTDKKYGIDVRRIRNDVLSKIDSGYFNEYPRSLVLTLETFSTKYSREQEVIIRDKNVKIVDKIDSIEEAVQKYPVMQDRIKDFYTLDSFSKTYGKSLRFVFLRGLEE